MLIYRDTGPNNNDACPGDWFDRNLVTGLQAFHCQFGFFRYKALEKYENILHEVSARNLPVRFVLGSNPVDRLTIEDIASLLKIVCVGDKSSLTIVAFGNALFHSKVAHVTDINGRTSALVGSPNLTAAGFGSNVESWLEISQTEQTGESLQGIVKSTNAWRVSAKEEGAFQVKTIRDAESLLAQKVIVTSKSKRAAIAKSRSESAFESSSLATRINRWNAPMTSGMPPADDELQIETVEYPPGTDDPAIDSLEDEYVDDAPVVLFRWCKRLSKSDVNKNARNERNLMSLVKGPRGQNQVMDDLDNIRSLMLVNSDWDQIRVKDEPAESVVINVLCCIDGHEPTFEELEVVHAPHRESGQANYHTCIRWNSRLARLFRNANQDGCSGYWAVLEKNNLELITPTIARSAPNPRGIGLHAGST